MDATRRLEVRSRPRSVRLTLLSLLVLLAACAPRVTRCTTDAKIDSDLVELRARLETHAQRTGALPRTWGELEAAAGVRVPLDPWKEPYLLTVSADGAHAVVGSFGRDGVPGGVGEDADRMLTVDLRPDAQAR